MKKIIVLIIAFLISSIFYINTLAMNRPIHHGSIVLNSSSFTKIVGGSNRISCIFWNTHAKEGVILNLCPLNKGVPMTGLFIPPQQKLILPEKLNYKGEIIGMAIADEPVLLFICW